jgi:hypothetical protein
VCLTRARLSGLGPKAAWSSRRAEARSTGPGPGGSGPLMVTLAVATALALATAVARTLTVAGLGATAGAVYRPDVLMVPTVPLPPVTPLTDQLTPVLVLPVTAAPKACVAPGASVTLVGDTVTAMGGGGVVVVVTPTMTVSLTVAPTPVWLTTSGSRVPACRAVVVPVAVIEVLELRVLVSVTAPRRTTTPGLKFEPFSRSVKAPTPTCVGALLHRCTGTCVTVIVASPYFVG